MLNSKPVRSVSSISYQERQLTSAAYGHTLHHDQVFSPDNQWIVYDTRNDDTHIGRTASIEMVNIHTGEVKKLYQTSRQTIDGPGVGAVSFSPVADTVIFIHGIRNSDRERPYSPTRRTGVAIAIDRPQQPIFMDARDVQSPYTPGALRGGTHAHRWSSDGEWLSFTYNDAVIENLSKTDSAVQDLRTVGVMMPGAVHVADDRSLENNSGTHFSAVIAEVTENPKPGSDEIDRAFDETWVGREGYIKADGTRQRRAIAFQGDVNVGNEKRVTEVFVADLPEDIKQSRPGHPLEGSLETRPNVPKGVRQRRITQGANISGPRHWLRTTPDGADVLYIAKDKSGIHQLFAVTINTGVIRQVTQNRFSVQGGFTVHPDGSLVVYAADNSLFVSNIHSGKTDRITPRFSDEQQRPVGTPVYSNDGKYIAYNRFATLNGEQYLQVYLLWQ